VDHYAADGETGGFETIGNVLGNGVSLADGEVAIDANLEVDEQAKAALADAALVDPDNAGDLSGFLTDSCLDFGRDGSIHDLVQCGAEDAGTVKGDDATSQKSGPIVGAFIAFAADERDGELRPSSQVHAGY
jgi:hypothetical protein